MAQFYQYPHKTKAILQKWKFFKYFSFFIEFALFYPFILYNKLNLTQRKLCSEKFVRNQISMQGC